MNIQTDFHCQSVWKPSARHGWLDGGNADPGIQNQVALAIESYGAVAGSRQKDWHFGLLVGLLGDLAGSLNIVRNFNQLLLVVRHH